MNEWKEWERCLCGDRVPAGDTGLCLQCEEGFLESPDPLVESEFPLPAEKVSDAPKKEKEVRK